MKVRWLVAPIEQAQLLPRRAQILFGSGFSEEERRGEVGRVHWNCIEGMKILVQGALRLEILIACTVRRC